MTAEDQGWEIDDPYDADADSYESRAYWDGDGPDDWYDDDPPRSDDFDPNCWDCLDSGCPECGHYSPGWRGRWERVAQWLRWHRAELAGRWALRRRRRDFYDDAPF